MQAAFADDWVGQASRRYHEARVRLLRKLRFGATILMICGVFAGYLGAIPGINVPVLSVVAAITLLFNLAVILDWVPCQKTDSAIPPGAMHAIVDMLLLTLVLWAIGGVHAPFLSNFVFHVAIVGILGGGRATILGACIAMLCTFLLSLTHYVPGLAIAVWNPRPPFDALSEFAAFSTVIIAIAYVTLDAVLELRRREEALRRAAEAVAIEYDVLTRTLRTIDAGLEVIGEGGVVLFENPRAAARFCDRLKTALACIQCAFDILRHVAIARQRKTARLHWQIQPTLAKASSCRQAGQKNPPMRRRLHRALDPAERQRCRHV